MDVSRLVTSVSWCAAGLPGAMDGLKGVGPTPSKTGVKHGGVMEGVRCANSRYIYVAELEFLLLAAHLAAGCLNLLFFRRSGLQGSQTQPSAKANNMKTMPVGV